MTRIEDRLTDAAQELRRSVGGEIDTEAALAAVAVSPRTRRRPLLGAAAAVLLVALVASGLVVAYGGDESHLVADGGVVEEHFDRATASDTVFGRMAMARASAQIDRFPRYRTLDQLLPNVTYEHADGSSEHLTDLVVLGRVTTVEPHVGFAVPDEEESPNGEPVDFDAPEALWRYVHVTVSVERSFGGSEKPATVRIGLVYYGQPEDLGRYEAAFRSLGTTVFFLRSGPPVPGDEPSVYSVLEGGWLIATVDDRRRLDLPVLGDDEADQLLEATPTLDDLIAAGERGSRTLSVASDGSIDERLPVEGSPTSDDGSDLAQPEPGREITFEGVGDVRLGQVLDASEVQQFEGSTCGYWGPAEPTHDGDEPPGGLVGGAGTAAPTVLSIQVRNNRYRTASGVGLDTTLATLQRIYGDDLVIDRADGWEAPTDGLLAQYQDVAAVRNGDRALTFGLRDDIVEWVKLSDAGFWGDDEGCA